MPHVYCVGDKVEVSVNGVWYKSEIKEIDSSDESLPYRVYLEPTHLKRGRRCWVGEDNLRLYDSPSKSDITVTKRFRYIIRIPDSGIEFELTEEQFHDLKAMVNSYG